MKIKRFSDNTQWNRSEYMKQLHASGRYLGTSKIADWNRSDERRERMRGYYERNILDKSSKGYGSEYHMRERSRSLLHNKFQGETGYMYFLEFPASVKVGFSKDWERRTTKQIRGGRVLLVLSGPTDVLADLEFDIFQKFQEYTKLSQDGRRYTEYLDKSCKKKILDYLKNSVKESAGKLEIISL